MRAILFGYAASGDLPRSRRYRDLWECREVRYEAPLTLRDFLRHVVRGVGHAARDVGHAGYSYLFRSDLFNDVV